MERNYNANTDTRYEKRNSKKETSTKRQPRYAAKEETASDQELYRAQAKKLLITGAIGFAIGFVFLFATEGEWQSALLMGFLFAGIPHGWTLLGKFLGHWLAFGSGAFMFLVYFLQFLGAVIIGWLAYPIALLKALTKAQAPGSVLHKVFRVCLILWETFLVFILGVIIFGSLFSGK